jgi:hypothetical protein
LSIIGAPSSAGPIRRGVDRANARAMNASTVQTVATKMPDNSVEHAHAVRPTREGEAPLLAAHSRR